MTRVSGAVALAGALLVAHRGRAHAGAVVEGTVMLPTVAAAPLAKPRYPVAASYAIGEPDPPAAVVYLEGPAGGSRPGRFRMAQQHYQFAPGVLPIGRGSVVEFPNLDEEYHSVFSYSKTKRFDLGRYRRDERPAALTFDQPGVVKLFCEIHDHMRGTIVVLDTPHFVRTDAGGRYRLDGLPAGRFVLKAWIDETTVRTRPVELSDGATLRVDFPAE